LAFFAKLSIVSNGAARDARGQSSFQGWLRVEAKGEQAKKAGLNGPALRPRMTRGEG